MPVPPPVDHAGPLVERPFISCVLAASSARQGATAAKAFESQTYAQREVVVVDDGDEPIGATLPALPGVRHVRLERPHDPYEKLTIGIRAAHGGLVAVWDPDAYYPPWRLEYQLVGMLAEGVEVSGRSDLLAWDPSKRALSSRS